MISSVIVGVDVLNIMNLNRSFNVFLLIFNSMLVKQHSVLWGLISIDFDQHTPNASKQKLKIFSSLTRRLVGMTKFKQDQNAQL